MDLPAPESLIPGQKEKKQASHPNLLPEDLSRSGGFLSLKVLPLASVQDWVGRSDEERQRFLLQIHELFVSILGELFEEGNLCVRIVKSSLASYRRWRIGLICATGGLAIVNLVVAYFSPKSGGKSEDSLVLLGLPLLAAVYAAGLAIFTNLESFYNHAARGQAYRESRELFLDTYREFEMLWHVRVLPFGDRAEACINASEVYRLLVERDRELRGKLRELTATKKPPIAAKPSND